MRYSESGEPMGRSRGGRLLRWAVLAGIWLAAVCCFAAEGALPDIAANDNRTPGGHLESGVLTLHLELREGLWQPEAPDGRVLQVYSFAEAGKQPQVPGPLIRVPQGTEIRASVHNLLPAAAYLHGFDQHPGDARNVIQVAAGETKEIRFAAGEPGSYVYWGTTSAGAFPDDEGPLSGAFIVDAPGNPVADRVFVIQLWSKHLYTRNFEAALTINGKAWPYTERLQAHLGQPEHWRIINASRLFHPMHLHGFFFQVDAVGDGETVHRYTAAERPSVVTRLVEPRQTFDMTWVPERAGNWIFHCHIVDHMLAFKSPVLYGPTGPPAGAEPAADSHDHLSTAMSGLVMGITVTEGQPQLVPAKAVVAPPAVERNLYIRERPARPYVAAGPGFYLEGVSQEVGAVGPPLVVTRGQRTAITVHNELHEPTAIHWHGIEIESYYDGVPGWGGSSQRTTPLIAPGSSFVAYMTPPRAGTFIYHTHWHDVTQLTSGMYGALLVVEPGQKYDPATEKVFVLGRGGPNEMHDPLVLNGSAQPGLMVLLTGQTYRFRLINIAPNDAVVDTSLAFKGHPAKWRPIAKDGGDLPAAKAVLQDAVQTISVGETYDFEFAPQEAGQYELRFSSALGSAVTQMLAAVPRSSAFSVYAEGSPGN